MPDLDNLDKIKKLDSQNVYQSVVSLSSQCQHAWDDTQNIHLPSEYQNINKIVATGMGGSGLGARFIKSVFANNLPFPFEQVNDYDLPSWVDQNTLVICSSYSGNTEETVNTANQAIKKKAKWLAICKDGQLLKLAKSAKVPFYQIDPKFNPSNQPRMAIGYSIIGQLSLVSKLKIISFTKKDLQTLISAQKRIVSSSNLYLPLDQNPAKKLASQMFQKQVIFAAAKHLTGSLHTAKNQMNENAKNLSHRHDLPELNHHLMEGLKFPQSNQKNVIFFFADSALYPNRIQQRLKLTQDVVEKNKIKSLTWKPASSTKLAQAFETIQFFGFVNFYLTVLNNIDPAPIPWVDYFKKSLK